MHRRVPSIVLFTSSILAACAATSGGSGAGAAGGSGTAASDWDGTAVPADGTVIAVWPEAYAGDLLVMDVLPQGALVKQGDVIAHVDMRPIDVEIRQAELEAHSALVRNSNLEEKDRIDREAAASALEQARSALDRARRALEGWEKHELEFSQRGAELEDRHRVAGIEDETDELTQLEKMYKADELIDATEEIVLKRSKRALDLSKSGLGLAREQRTYQQTYEEAMQTEVKREAVRVQTGALDRLVQSQAIDKRAAEDAALRSKAQLAEQQKKLDELRRDRELLSLQAPRSGILLYGSLDNYRPKETPPRYERGSRLATRSKIFTIADPEKLVIAVDIPETKLKVATPGSAVEVRPAFDPELSVPGKLRIAEFPEAKSAAAAENSFEATVDLDHQISGLRVGMRVKVKPVPGSGTSSAKTASKVGAPSDAERVRDAATSHDSRTANEKSSQRETSSVSAGAERS